MRAVEEKGFSLDLDKIMKIIEKMNYSTSDSVVDKITKMTNIFSS